MSLMGYLFPSRFLEELWASFLCFERTRLSRRCCGFSASRRHVDSCLREAVYSLCRGRGTSPGSVWPTSHLVAQVHTAHNSAMLTPELSVWRRGLHLPPRHPGQGTASSTDAEEESQAKGMQRTLGPTDPFISK